MFLSHIGNNQDNKKANGQVEIVVAHDPFHRYLASTSTQAFAVTFGAHARTARPHMNPGQRGKRVRASSFLAHPFLPGVLSRMVMSHFLLCGAVIVIALLVLLLLSRRWW